MIDSKSPSEPILVTKQAEIKAMCKAVQEDAILAFDTEFVMEDCYESEICLFQLATTKAVYLIDPFLNVDLGPVWALVTDPKVKTVVHAGVEDLGLCYQHTHSVPRNVFDIQIAAGLVSQDYPLSLQKVVRSKLNIQLHKAKTLTDWRKRPLSDAQISYAAKDVEYLLPIHKKLSAQLKRRNRLEWAQEEFAQFEQESLYLRAEGEKLRRVRGTGPLRGQQLAIAQALMQWREQAARNANRPARTLLRDHLLVEVAKHGFSTPAEVKDLRGINLSAKNLSSLCSAVRAALKIPEKDWPKQSSSHQSERPEEAALVALLTAVLRSYCMDNQLAYSLAATKKAIQQLVRCHTRGEPKEGCDLQHGWRRDTVGSLIDDILQGNRTVRVTSRDGKLGISCTPPRSRASSDSTSA